MYAAIVSNTASDRDLLHQIASQFSPVFEEIGEQAVIIDIDGNSLLIGSEQNIAEAISTIAAEANITINIAIAQNPDAALCAAQFRKGITVIKIGKEAE